ncbi:DUF7511 domain-containing protein [Halopiger goleimassiliensis]|uniref:DUF7511 domain-containing protein n=1 Tax=Halopiger goleimassiliensis TaxID=1293048 RepID=UPI0006779194|nr:hypothetical protein [Halopiger goleimassiliensis]
MTLDEASVTDDARASVAPLELLTDDEEVWTAVPVDADGDERVTRWISIDGADLCDLEEWR